MRWGVGGGEMEGQLPTVFFVVRHFMKYEHTFIQKFIQH